MAYYIDLTKETPVNERKAAHGVLRRQTIRRAWFCRLDQAQEYRFMHLQDPKPTITVGPIVSLP